MSSPLDLLPLIDGNTYTFVNEEVGGETISPGNSQVAQISGVDRGYYFGIVTTIVGEGGQDTELEITVDDFVADTTPREMFESGFVNPQGIAPGVSEYDTTNNIFTAIHNPQRIIGFNDEVRFRQRAPNEASNLAVDSQIFSIGITKPREFARQYLQLVNPGAFDETEINTLIDRFEDRL